MTFTHDDLEKTIRLAHLSINDDKKPHYLQQLQTILDQVSTIEALDLSDIKPSYSAIDQEQYQREDIAQNSSFDLSQNAPEWEDHAFRVPRILKS
jgi:aspartyl-tRNA(Asn)/glutamyl-tRNA(Gln) amidotransferase subunit C